MPVFKDNPLATASHLHCTAASSRSFTAILAIRKDAGICCGSRLRKGEVFAYVGRNQNLKDLKGRRALLRIPSTEGRSVCLGCKHFRVALGREEPWPRARPGRHHRSPSTGLERSVGLATGVRVGGSHGLCAPMRLLVGYCGG